MQEYAADLENRLRTLTTLREADIAQIISRFECRRFARHELLLREGEQCDFWGFVRVGLVRLYTHTAAGDEYTNGFAQEGAFLTDMVSFCTQTPSLENMAALEDSELLYLRHARLQQVFQDFPAFEQFGRRLYEDLLVQIKQRVFHRIHAEALARYRYLLRTQPDLLRRVPLKYLASYLSVTGSTLSRIRRQLRGQAGA